MTIHGALGLSVKGSQQRTSAKLTRLWSNKMMLILDEVSMISLNVLHEIEEQCRIIRNSDIEWGGLKVVLLCGDFYQFPPVTGHALWHDIIDTGEFNNAKKGKRIWNSFLSVILLDQQMRQNKDVEFAALLKRIREGATTKDDCIYLMDRVSQFKYDQETKVIVRSNQLRQYLNIKLTVEFAETHKQPVYIFMASHHAVESSGHHATYIEMINNWQCFTLGDRGSNVPGPGLFFFTKNMPIVINQNIYTSLGIVNGKEGIATDIIMEPSSKVYRLVEGLETDENREIWIIDQQPKCLLVGIKDSKFSNLSGLAKNILPLFPTTFGIDITSNDNAASNSQKLPMRRRQIPCCAGFAITDYRSQGRTFNRVVIDLEPPNIRWEGGHRTFTAVYVALSRCRSLDGLSFFRAFSEKVLTIKPDSRLASEMARLKKLEENTLKKNYQEILSKYQLSNI